MGLHDRPTSLYRFFDAQGRLVYVGITGALTRRLAEHQGTKDWFGTCARVELEHFADRGAAMAAERAAVAAERPIYNVQLRSKVGAKLGVEGADVAGDRLTDAIAMGLDPGSLIGSFFHSGADPGWQGCVVAEPRPGMYLVELFGWNDGVSTSQRLVLAEEMTHWRFYDTPEWMNDAYVNGVRWDKERGQS